MAAFISSKFHEEGDNESVTARRDNAILNELKNALTLIRGFNVKLDNNRNFLANTTAQDFVDEFEKCLKNVLVDVSKILKNHKADTDVIRDALADIGIESRDAINKLFDALSRIEAKTIGNLKNLNGSKFFGSFHSLSEFDEKVLGGAYSKIANLMKPHP